MKKFFVIIITSLVLLSSCSSYTSNGAIAGGMIGSAIGGIAGGYRGSDVGMLVGAVTGAAIGAAAEEQERKERYQRAYEDEMYYESRAYRAEQLARQAEQRARNAEQRAAYAEQKAYRAEKKAIGTRNSGFRFERSQDPGRKNDTIVRFQVNPSDTTSYSQKGVYDDRIEF